MELDHTMSDMLAELVITNRCSTSSGTASVEARKPSPFGVVESVRRTYVVEALTLWRSSESEVRRVGECDTLKDAIETAQQVIDESLITWNYDGTTVEKLFTRYERFGEIPFIFVDTEDTMNVIGFNALNYAMKQCEMLCARCQGEPVLNVAS